MDPSLGLEEFLQQQQALLQYQQKLVLDCGTGYTKAGFAGEDAPRLCFETTLGGPRQPGLTGTCLGAKKDNFVGSHASSHRGLLTLANPIQKVYMIVQVLKKQLKYSRWAMLMANEVVMPF